MSVADRTFYERLGGDSGIRGLVREFYHLMDTLPEATHLRELHPASIEGSEEKLYLYLTGWSGGPPLYSDKFGHPMLRRRHLPFAIDELARDQWLLCMERALRSREGIEQELFNELMLALYELADHMRNDPDGR